MSYQQYHRCGNSAFFGDGWNSLHASLVNPVDLVWITTSADEKPPEAIFLLYRRVPEIDIQIAKEGAPGLFGTKKALKAMLSSLQGWKDIRETALQEGASRTELTAYFSRLSTDRRNKILEGVQSLINGWQDRGFALAIEEVLKRQAPGELMRDAQEARRLAIARGSSVHEEQADAEEFQMVTMPSVVEDNLETAFWKALEDFGVLEC